MNDGLQLIAALVIAMWIGAAVITWHVCRHLSRRRRDSDALLSAHGDFPNVPEMRKPPRG